MKSNLFLFISLILPTVYNCSELSTMPPCTFMEGLNSSSKRRTPKLVTNDDFQRNTSTRRGKESINRIVPCHDGFTSYSTGYCDVPLMEFCYSEQRVNFPYECQYLDYEQIIGEFPTEGAHYLAKRDPLYGYYEINRPGPYYRTLVSTDEPKCPSEWLECAIGWTTDGCMPTLQLGLANCEGEEVNGFCFYNSSQYNFCDNFRQICDKQCTCVEYKNRFSCERSGCSENDCEGCVEKFESYPSPEVILTHIFDTVFVRIKHPLKVAGTYEPALYCFSENNDPSSEVLWEKHPLYLFEMGDYGMYLPHGGLYWCEYFTYPNMEVMSSGEFLFEYEDVLSFILNITVPLNPELPNDYSFLPYNIPSITLNQIRTAISNAVNETVDLFLVRIYPIRYSDNTMDFTYRVNLREISAESFPLFHQVLQNAVSTLIDNEFAASVSLAPADRCLGTPSFTHSNFTFPTTLIGGVAVPNDTIIVDENGLPITRRCFGSYVNGALWGEFNASITVGSVSRITKDLFSLLSKNMSADERSTDLLRIMTEGPEVVIPYDIYLISQILLRIVSSEDLFNIVTFTNNVNHVMGYPRNILSESQQSLNATDTILYNFDLAFGRIVNENATGPGEIPFHIQSDLILAQVANIKISKVNGVAIYQRNGKYVMESLTSVSAFDMLDFSNLIFATYLPPAFLELPIIYFGDDFSLVTVFFLNDALFDPKSTETLAKYAVSLFIPNFEYVPRPDLVIPMYFNVTGENRTCAFWRYGIDSQMNHIFGSWKHNYDALDVNGTVCHFEHMTHFSLLVNAPTDVTLNILNQVASIASIIGTLLIVVTALVFPKWREQSGTVVLLNYSVSVLAQHILLFLFEINTRSEGVFCKTIGILSHYVILVQFSWILVISYAQYLRLVVVFGSLNDFLIKICISSWIIPMIPVGIATGANLDNYDCFLIGYSFYFALVLPISVIIVINLLIFARILHSLFCTKVQIPTKRNEFQRVSVCIILLFLTGFTWIFGILANIFNSIVLSYIFCILTAFHGLILCIYFVLMQHYTRGMWLQKLYKCCGNVEYKRGSFSVTKSS